MSDHDIRSICDSIDRALRSGFGLPPGKYKVVTSGGRTGVIMGGECNGMRIDLDNGRLQPFPAAPMVTGIEVSKAKRPHHDCPHCGLRVVTGDEYTVDIRDLAHPDLKDCVSHLRSKLESLETRLEHLEDR